MKLENIRSQIDKYFDNITDEKFYQTLLKYMKKTIFEGTVNGTKFDNVEDYNNAITRAIANGEPINASSNTRTADEIQEPSVGQDISLFPGFAHCASLDSLDMGFIKAGLEIPSEQFDKSVLDLLNEKIIPAIGKMNKADATRYKTLVEGIMAHLGKISSGYEQYGRDLDARLEKLNKEIEVLARNAEAAVKENRIVQVTSALYGDINEAVSRRLATFTEPSIPHPNIAGAIGDKIMDGHPDSAGEPGACGDPCTYGQATDDYIENVRKLVRTIFG